MRSRLLVTLIAASCLPLTALPQRDRATDDEERAPPTIGATTGRILNEAIELLNMDDLAGVRETLGELKIDRLSPYERSRVEQILASVDFAEERYESAREHLNLALSSGGLNENEAAQVQYQIAQLFMTEERWAEGAAALEEWFEKAANPNSAAYYLLAAAYYQQGDLERAFEPAQKAVKLSDEPQVSWVELLVALYVEREDYAPALPLAERLVDLEPDRKMHWIRLSSFYQQLERHDRALAALQVPYNAGMFTEDSEYRRLADLLLFNEIPYRAARVLEAGLDAGVVASGEDAYEKLANCWIAARELDQAIPPLERAAELADDGALYVRLGEVHLQREEWAPAAGALEQALDKGGLPDSGKAELLMGVALYGGGRAEDALEWFERARGSDSERRMAEDYIRLIEAEMQ